MYHELRLEGNGKLIHKYTVKFGNYVFPAGGAIQNFLKSKKTDLVFAL